MAVGYHKLNSSGARSVRRNMNSGCVVSSTIDNRWKDNMAKIRKGDSVFSSNFGVGVAQNTVIADTDIVIVLFGAGEKRLIASYVSLIS